MGPRDMSYKYVWGRILRRGSFVLQLAEWISRRGDVSVVQYVRPGGYCMFCIQKNRVVLTRRKYGERGAPECSSVK